MIFSSHRESEIYETESSLGEEGRVTSTEPDKTLPLK